MNDISITYDTLADVDVESIDDIDLKSISISFRTMPVILRSILCKIENTESAHDDIVREKTMS